MREAAFFVVARHAVAVRAKRIRPASGAEREWGAATQGLARCARCAAWQPSGALAGEGGAADAGIVAPTGFGRRRLIQSVTLK